VATVVIFCTPGMFGFLVWELKENFRLYASNRPTTLQPIQVGHHGETVRRLLRPGFHSGTIPKCYARLRRAIHRTDPHKRALLASKQRTFLHHVEESIRHFATSDLVLFLEQSGRWPDSPPRLGRLVLGLHTIQIEFIQAGIAEHALWVELGQSSGWITASIRD